MHVENNQMLQVCMRQTAKIAPFLLQLLHLKSDVFLKDYLDLDWIFKLVGTVSHFFFP